jgi:hypothetical protein
MEQFDNQDHENELDQIAKASNYRTTATIYRMNAEILLKHFEAEGESCVRNIRAIPFYFLMCHSFELLLKCALLKRDIAPSKLKSIELRHGLINLADMLEKKGQVLTAETKLTISTLDDDHKRHVFRYDALSTGAYTPPADKLFECYNELLLAGRLSMN